MSSGIDYEFIRAILERLDKEYPARVAKPWGDESDDVKIVRHLSYLVEHGLILASITTDKRGNYNISRVQITPKGIDFLLPDGRLSALTAPMIRIAPDSLSTLIDAVMEARNVSSEERSLIKKAIRIAGTEGLTTIVRRLIETGLDSTTDLLSLFRLP